MTVMSAAVKHVMFDLIHSTGSSSPSIITPRLPLNILHLRSLICQRAQGSVTHKHPNVLVTSRSSSYVDWPLDLGRIACKYWWLKLTELVLAWTSKLATGKADELKSAQLGVCCMIRSFLVYHGRGMLCWYNLTVKAMIEPLKKLNSLQRSSIQNFYHIPVDCKFSSNTFLPFEQLTAVMCLSKIWIWEQQFSLFSQGYSEIEEQHNHKVAITLCMQASRS